jgi:GNAT superfamily N-acetyltransferase
MIKQILDENTKNFISKKVLDDLTEWFGLPEHTKNYIVQSSLMPYFAAYVDEEPIGFISLKETSFETAEIYCMGVMKSYHRKHIGKQLFEQFEQYAKRKGYKILQVKTVQFGKHESYDKTNLFYRSLGFFELEVFPTLWDEWNPCQILVKPINQATSQDKISNKK